jgi:MFS family permease
MTAAAAVRASPAVKGATFGLAILTFINLMNYLDRYLVAGVLPRIQADLNVSDTQAGIIGSLFIIVYMIASPLGGWLGDNFPRRYLVGGSVLLWSIATVGSGLAKSYPQLLAARSVIGIGEAGYATVAPAIIADLFAREKRVSMLSIFYLAIPVGSALGYALGGYIGEHHSWNAAFFVGGAPGILLGVAALFMPEPERGASEDGPVAKVPVLEGIAALRTNALFWFNTAGLTLMTFSIGGLAFWMPKYLIQSRGMADGEAGFWFGACTAVAGIIGTLAGGWLGDRADRWRPNGSMWVSGGGLLLAAPFMLLATLAPSAVSIFAAIFAAQFFVFLNQGPINSALVNAVSPGFRAFAMGLNVLIIHLLGDASSPTVIGWLSEQSSLRTAIQVNAVPVVLGGMVLVAGARKLATAR